MPAPIRVGRSSPYSPLKVTHPPRAIEDTPIDGATVVAAYAVIASITAAMTIGAAVLWSVL